MPHDSSTIRNEFSLTKTELKRRVHNIARSRVPVPKGTLSRSKYVFWKYYGPFHPLVRDIAVFIRLVRHHGRQPFVLGSINTVDDFHIILGIFEKAGYGNHGIAWKDKGELISLRLATTFTHQYHVRIFSDGEIRAHYEHTPEAHPVLHMLEIGMQEHVEYFKGLLGNTIRWHSEPTNSSASSPSLKLTA